VQIVKRLLLCAAVLAALAPSAPAAGIDWGGQIVTAVNTLVTSKGDILVHDGLWLLTVIGVAKLLLLIIPALLRRMDMFHHMHFNFSEIFILLFQIALCSVALHHYSTPFPGTSLSLHQIPTAVAQSLVTEFDTATMDTMNNYIQTTLADLSKPSPLALLDCIVYITIVGMMGLVAAGLFLITSFGFAGIGLFVVIGPLFIPLALTKHFYSWFWNWLQGLVAFSAYRVMSTVLGWVWSQVYIYFFVNGVGSDYSIGHWIVLLPVVLMLTVAFLFTMFSIPKITAMLFSGAGSIGQDFVSSGMTVVRAAAAKAAA
jgi:hypothetical protein